MMFTIRISQPQNSPAPFCVKIASHTVRHGRYHLDQEYLVSEASKSRLCRWIFGVNTARSHWGSLNRAGWYLVER